MCTTELLIRPRCALFALVTLACFVGVEARAQTAIDVDGVRTMTRTLMQSMCGEQCDVVDVKIKKRPVTPAHAITPGFDDSPQPRTRPAEIALTLLFDSKLTKAYRDFVSERIRQRVGELGLPVLVTQQVKPFPPPPPIPNEPVAPQPALQQPAPVIIQQPPVQQPAPAPAPEPVDLETAFWLRLIEALPAILLFLLLAWMVFRVLKRMENMSDPRGLEPIEEITVTPEVIDETSAPIPVPAQTLPPPSKEAITSDLRQFRSSTRRIYRRLLLKGDFDTVARSVALIGDFVVQDLSHDPALRRALSAAGSRTAETLREPLTDEEREELLRTVQAELVADRVAHRADDVHQDLEVLLGWGPEAFAAMMNRLDDRLALVLLRHAPGHLTESYLRGLSAEQRAKVVRKILDAPAAEPEEIAVLSDSIHEQQQAALVGGYEADHIVDLLDALPAEEQDTVVTELETTKPAFVRRNLGQLPVESALLRVPDHALSSAWAKVPFDEWISYLRAAPEEIRKRAIKTCPARLRDGVVEELGLRVAQDPAKATLARRKIVRAALNAAPLGQDNGAALDASVVQQKGQDVLEGRKAVPERSSAKRRGES